MRREQLEQKKAAYRRLTKRRSRVYEFFGAKRQTATAADRPQSPAAWLSAPPTNGSSQERAAPSSVLSKTKKSERGRTRLPAVNARATTPQKQRRIERCTAAETQAATIIAAGNQTSSTIMSAQKQYATSPPQTVAAAAHAAVRRHSSDRLATVGERSTCCRFTFAS